MKEGLAVTADGAVFRGLSVGVDGSVTGEVVFNTAMAGYQEVFSDPSYAGQVVVMTAPHIGNYGINAADDQSHRTWATAVIVRSLSETPSNWQSERSLPEYLQAQGLVALSEVDTRRLTRHIRERGAQPIAVGVGVTEAELRGAAEAAPRMEGQDLATGVSTAEPYVVEAEGERRSRVVAIDLGLKRDILLHLTSRGCEVVVMPAGSTADQVEAREPGGVFLSNGPGDPGPLIRTVETTRALLGRLPIFGICLGHQILGLALGATTFKLPFGHHGANHPVRRLVDGRVEITSQNHGFSIDPWSLASKRSSAELPEFMGSAFGPVSPTHQNLNDGTLEGLKCLDALAFGVQFHPEAAPGPRDSSHLFDQFTQMMSS